MSYQKKRQQYKPVVKMCAFLLGLCLTVGLSAGAVSADDEEVTNRLQNGSFEEGQTFTKSYLTQSQDSVPSWNTTASNKKIELFRENSDVYVKNDNGAWVKLTPTAGTYAAELNADEESTLYQTVSTSPTSIYEWGLDHGARNGTDIMALVIGPAQDVAPSKPSQAGRDQFMQMVDWLKDDEQNPTISVEINNIKAGAQPQQYTVYSKKFAAGGTFVDNAGNDAFSLTPSTIYTEEWHIWIMASNRATTETVNPWNSFGSNVEGTAGSSDDSGVTEVDLSKYYLYKVPAGQTKTLFGFVSVGYVNSPTTADKAKTYGNFLDNINFQLYHPLSGSTTAHGSAVVGASDGTTEGEGGSNGREVTVDKKLTTYVTDGEPLKVQAVVRKADAEAGCEFVGLYYTTQDEDGNPKTEFLQLAGNAADDSAPDEEKEGKWVRSMNADGDTVYTYYLDGLTSPTDLHFVFIKNPTITYDPNGGEPYEVERTYNTSEAANVYSFKPVTGEGGPTITFISPYVSHAAEGPKDPENPERQNGDWKFMGWLLTGDTVNTDDIPSGTEQINEDKLGNLLLPAVHTVACDYVLSEATGENPAQYFKIYGDNVTLTETINEDGSGKVMGVTWTDNGEEIAYANVHKGLTMVAQWRWRQAFIPQLSEDDTYVDSAKGGTVEITSVTDESDANYNDAYNDYGGKAYFAATNEIVTVTAAANPGYTFEGWYDADGNLLTTNTTYGYTETKEGINTCYARFSGSVTQTYIRQVWNGETWEDTTNDAIGTLGRYTYTDAVGMPISSTAAAGEGYKFEGWYDSDGNEVAEDMLINDGATISYTTTGNATYYARFSEKVDRPVERQVSATDYKAPYDGSAHGITVNGATLPGDKVYYSLNQSAWSETAPTRTTVQNAETIYVKVENPDYKTATARATITITPRPITITVDDAEKFYGESDPGFTGGITSGVLVRENDLGTISYSRTNDAERVGIYVDVLTASYTENENYNVTVTPGDFTIKTATVTGAAVVASGGSRVYNGQPFAASAEVTGAEGYTVYYKVGEDEWTTAAPSVTNVSDGTVTVSVKATKTGYAPLTCGDVTITIIPRPITITADSASKVYDSEELTKDTFTTTVPTEEAPDEGLVPGQSVTATVTGSQTRIGSSDNVASDAEIKAGDVVVTGNYTISYAKGTLTVTGAEGITVTKVPAQTKVTPGGTITWTVTVCNIGRTEANGLILTDTLEGAEVTAPEGVNPANFSVSAGDKVEFTVTYKNAKAGTYTNHVEVSQSGYTDDGGNTARKIAEADAAAVKVREPDDHPVTPSKPVLNTEDHYSYIIGYKDGTLRPYGTITRGEVATIFFRLLTDETREEYWSQTNDYTDCNSELWCNNAISTLSNMGIIDGFADGTFRPYAKITRAQFAKIAVGFFETTKADYEGFFTDVNVGAWYTEYVEAAARVGLIQGFENGTFQPNSNITRAQACVIVNRALNRKPDEEHLLDKDEMLTWVDNNPGDWFYADMQEATNSHDYIWLTEAQEKTMEEWTAKLPQRDWAALEHAWSTAHSAPGGEVTR